MENRKFETEEIEKQVWQGLETIIRGEDDSVDVCGFEMCCSNWDGQSLFEFEVEIDDKTFELWLYLTEYDNYDILTLGAKHALEKMADKIVYYLQKRLEEE